MARRPPATIPTEAEALTAAAIAARAARDAKPKTKRQKHDAVRAALDSAYQQVTKALTLTNTRLADAVTPEASAEVTAAFYAITPGKRKARTAAAMTLDPIASSTKGMNVLSPNAVTRTWQHAAWGYVHSVGELNSGKMYVGNFLGRCRLVVGKRDPDGTIEQGFQGDAPVEGLDNEIANQAAEIIARFQSKIGGQSELLRSMGEKMFVTGELFIVPRDTPRMPGGLTFEVLSTQELLPQGDHFAVYRGPGWSTEDLPPTVNPIRMWRPDSQYGMLADSSVRSCLEVLEELVVLTRLVRASAISRMALSGILCIPDELDFPTDDEAQDGTEEKSSLAVDILNTGSKAIDDPASAAAFMPYILQGPADALRDVHHVPFQGDDQENVIKRTEALQRLAQGLDLPVEVTLGHQQTTFANAAQVSQDTFNLHLLPTLQMICDTLTHEYLWPAMAIERGIDAEHVAEAPYPPEILTVAVTFDARNIISKPDRVKELLDYASKDITFATISKAERREALGLDPDGGPDDEEVAFMVNAYRLAHSRETIAAGATEAAVPVATAVPTSRGGPGLVPHPSRNPASKAVSKEEDEAGATPKTGKPAVAAPATASPPAANGAVPPPQPAVAAALTPADNRMILATLVAGATEFAVDRGVERVGAKLRSKVRSAAFTEAERASIAAAENASVARRLGQPAVERILGDVATRTLLAEVNGLARRVGGWASSFGLDDPGIVGAAVTLARELATEALYSKDPVHVGADVVADALFGVGSRR